MNTDHDKFLIPIILGVLGEDGIVVNDQILEKLITPQLIKIKNTFPNSPFIVLSPMANEKERLMTCLIMDRLEAGLIVALSASDDSAHDLLKVDIGEGVYRGSDIKTIGLDNIMTHHSMDEFCSPAVFTAGLSQILIALMSDSGKDEKSEVSKALVLRYEGRVQELLSMHSAEDSTLDTTDVGLVITIDPVAFDIHSFTTPARGPVLPSYEPEHGKAGFVDKLSFAFNRYVQSVTGIFDKFYASYFEVPGDTDKDRLVRSPFVEIAKKIDGYNSDIKSFFETRGVESALKSEEYLLRDEAENPLVSGNNALKSNIALYSGADVLSQFYQKRTNTFINWIYILFFAAVLLYGIIDLNYYLVLFYIALIPAIAFLVHRSKADKIEDRLLDYRALAEGLRVMVFWDLSGINEKVSANYLSKYPSLLSWISRAIKNIELKNLADRGVVGTEEAKASEAESAVYKGKSAAYKEELIKITSKLWIGSQLEYFARKRSPLHMRSLDLGNLALVSFVLTLLIVLTFGIYILFAGMGNDGATTKFEVLIGVVASVGVAALAYKNKKAYDELERRYSLTQRIYASAYKKLQARTGAPDNILITLGKEALLENGHWLWTHRNLPIELPKE